MIGSALCEKTPASGLLLPSFSSSAESLQGSDPFSRVMGSARGCEHPEFSAKRLQEALDTVKRLGSGIWGLDDYDIDYLQKLVREASEQQLDASEMKERCLFIRPLPLGYPDPSDVVQHGNVISVFDTFGKDFTLRSILGNVLRTGECTFVQDGGSTRCAVQCYNSVRAYTPLAVALLHAPELFRLDSEEGGER